jgi:trk system potassium uptake protein TrkH
MLIHPARLVPLAFLLLIAIGTIMLMLPVATASGRGAPFVTALFTATSAVSVTGLSVVDTATYWSRTGQVFILILLQIGGFGVMSAATLLMLMVSRRLSLSNRVIVQAEARGIAAGEIRQVLRFVLALVLAIEAVAAALLTIRFAIAYDHDFGEALWHGVFHGVAAFTNAGFSTYSDSMVGFARDPLVLLVVASAVVLGGLGLPVLHELRQDGWNYQRWSLHTRMTLFATALLLPAGALATLAMEWSNPLTIGGLGLADRVVNAVFHSAMTRSGGLNSFDVGAIRQDTMLISYALMLIGGGSASMAGGIKVTTFLILGIIVLSEVRGERDVHVFRRRLSSEVQRQSLTVVLLGLMIVFLAILLMRGLSEAPLRVLVFEVISAFANVGLSMGVTAELPPAGQLLLVVLMFVGRVGTVTVATALALRDRKSAFRYPEECPVVG